MKIKILVVDDNESIINMVGSYFKNNTKAEVVKSVRNGKEAIEVLESDLEYDIVLLDLVMPIKDGFGVLKYMKDNKITKKVIVMTSFNQEDVIRDVSEYNVRYYALKPFNLEDLETKITNAVNSQINNDKIIELGNRDIQIKITEILHALGIPSHIKGYQFIRTAIMMVYENPGYIGGITKDLYPGLSMKFNTSIQRVERAIRHAIEVSWLRGDIELMEEIFGHSVDIDRAKPTNSEFIVTIADKLRLEMINVR